MENRFQASLIKSLRNMFPGCMVLKNDANYLQGVPDLLVLWNTTWAALECKAGPTSSRQPNQEYYIDLMDGMSFAAFITPQNQKRVLHDLQLAFGSRRPARVSERQQVSLDKLRRRQTGGSLPQHPGSQARQ